MQLRHGTHASICARVAIDRRGVDGLCASICRRRDFLSGFLHPSMHACMHLGAAQGDRVLLREKCACTRTLWHTRVLISCPALHGIGNTLDTHAPVVAPVVHTTSAVFVGRAKPLHGKTDVARAFVS